MVVIDETTAVVCRRRCRPTRESLETIEAAALDGAADDMRLEVIIEPTGAAWLPVAVFFARRGHVVHRVSSAKAAALRRFLSQHAKSNSIDAEALARLAIFDPDGLQLLQLAHGAAASLDRQRPSSGSPDRDRDSPQGAIAGAGASGDADARRRDHR